MTLPAYEIETAANSRYSVIWLHGLGADGNDFAPIVPQLVDRAWGPIRFVFPHAPVRPVTINNGMSMRAWYDIAAFDLNARQDEAGMRASVAAVESLIGREHERGVPSERIVLAGFSQGGAIALAAGLQYAEKLAGIIALSTYLPTYAALASERSAANAAIPIFWGHGTVDPVVVLQRGLESRDVLQSLGYAVEWHSYLMAHAVCPEEIGDLRHWLSQRLA
ncbi:carboxylesterase [Rhodanobacter sp. C03]|uniref:alpha/beta hydrolase n=1 Tax=Rhodanobacter sp. C03 TaxID=1945858 RepID=UPI0009843B96|nr:carboxylesterase [Rhodanobacter sp. C03]OOG59275.1 carboxylesterase [Rhodanobacter sp. C03]